MLFSFFLAWETSGSLDGFCFQVVWIIFCKVLIRIQILSEVTYMKLFDLTRFFNLKKISIFSVLLIMFSLVPGCALAEEETAQPSITEEDFDTMQSRMAETVDRMIETLENSTEDLDGDTLASAEEMISELTSIKDEISEAETESDLQTIREELDSLLAEAPEELKSIPGFGMGSGPGNDKNGSQAPPQGSGNMSQERPEMPDGTNPMDKNAVNENSSMEKQETPGQTPAEEKSADSSENVTRDSTEAGFFEKLINSLKSLFS